MLFNFKINKEGSIAIFSWIAFSLIISMFFISFSFTCIALSVGGFLCFFFRDPDRELPAEEGVIISPADGKVIDIIKCVDGPDVLGLQDQKMTQIVIFLSVFDVHVNRIPISGKVKNASYFVGKMKNALLLGSQKCDDCERQYLNIEDKNGNNFVIVQIAGALARRIVCNSRAGDDVKIGDRYGIICFGSRVDLYIPESISAEIKIEKGKKVFGGTTIIATL